jgi:tRNA threonylcarbamoyladenosine modification (KEOPS) complex  Pcc1 subunit
MTMASSWSGTILLRCSPPGSARRLCRALQPEAAREVPRARARISLAATGQVRIELTARDTGALRAALNTYLGWVALAQRTEAVAGAFRPAEER